MLEMVAKIILIALIVMIWLVMPFAIILGVCLGWKYSNWVIDKLDAWIYRRS